METKTSPQELQSKLYSLLVPQEILNHFEVTAIVETPSYITIELTEKPDQVPKRLKDKKPVLDGYLNVLELQSYPIQGKSCYLKLRRRRWKEKGTDSKQSYWNEYSFEADGTKATKAFGAFLKEYLS